jgi:hypothetical protein
MSGNSNPTNKRLEELVEKAGVGKHVLEDPERVVCDDVWTEERERLAREHLSQDKTAIPAFWQSAWRGRGHQMGGDRTDAVAACCREVREGGGQELGQVLQAQLHQLLQGQVGRSSGEITACIDH